MPIFRSIIPLLAAAILFGRLLPASTPEELTTAAMIAGQDPSRRMQSKTQMQSQSEWERLVRITRYEPAISNDRNAEAIWEQAQRDAEEALAVLARIYQIDNAKPSDWDTVTSGLKAAFEDTDKKRRTEFAPQLWLRIAAEIGKASLQADFRRAEAAMEKDLAELVTTAVAPIGSLGIGLTHLPSWQGAYDNDLVVVRNETGIDLSTAAIFVFIQGKDGAVSPHLHRVSNWAKDQEVSFRYAYRESDYANPGTVLQPTRVDVAVFSEGVCIRAAKSWAGRDFDSLVRQYMASVRMSAVFLGEYVEEGTNSLFFPGVKFSVAGLKHLPIRRITVRLLRRGDTEEVVWDWDKFLFAGEDVVLRSKYFSRFGRLDPPEQKQIILEFTDSSVVSLFTL